MLIENMENRNNKEVAEKISDSAYSTSGNSQSKRSCSLKSMRSGSHSSRSSGYCGKPSTSGYSYRKTVITKADGPHSNAKISNSLYSNSCSNSQSRKSYSSKSVHSGSNSSGSSGYCGKPSTSGYSHYLRQLADKRKQNKEARKKIPVLYELKANKDMKRLSAPAPIVKSPAEEIKDVVLAQSPMLVQIDTGAENMQIATPDRRFSEDEETFSCVISMQDGIVMYTTETITTALGYPKDMWIGRSFIDFLHQRDRDTFASQITSGLAMPKNSNGTVVKVPTNGDHISTMVCRIRQYKGLSSGFGVKGRVVTFMPFLVKLFFKNVNDSDSHVIYLVLQATPFFSAYKSPNEMMINPTPFIIRHSSNGKLEYVDTASVPYLGYVPQDILDKDALMLYHPSDLIYLHQVYEKVIREGGILRSRPYRMMTQNGDYLKLETEWSSFTNPWSKKLEFIIGKHYILEGPMNPNIFRMPNPDRMLKLTDEDKIKAHLLRQNILRLMSNVLTKPAELAKQKMNKRCEDLATFMQTLLDQNPTKPLKEEPLKIRIDDTDYKCQDRDPALPGDLSPHDDFSDSKSGSNSPLSYTQLNYNETLQRYFDSYEPYTDYDQTQLAELNKLHKEESVNGHSRQSSNEDSEEYVEKKTTYCDATALVCVESPPAHLTEAFLIKHNEEMEKQLKRLHRGNRINYTNYSELSIKNKQKTREHLARCTSYYYESTDLPQYEFKPDYNQLARQDYGVNDNNKHNCAAQRYARRNKLTRRTSMHSSTAITTTVAVTTPWPVNSVSSMNALILGLGIPQQMSILNSLGLPGVIPMCYNMAALQSTSTAIPTRNLNHNNVPNDQILNSVGSYTNLESQYRGHIDQSNVLFTLNPNCAEAGTSTGPQTITDMVANHKIDENPFKYSTIDPQVSYTVQKNFVPHNAELIKPLELPQQNYEDSMKTVVSNRSTRKSRRSNCGSIFDKTDDDSSSSFYSSFFKTDSGSAEDSDTRNGTRRSDDLYWRNKQRSADSTSYQSFDGVEFNPYPNKVARSKIQPPWMENVCVTSELVFKYQITTKNIEEVLQSDREKLLKMEQPTLVNEQLAQLYLDLQLQGVTARLTLDESNPSSSSSEEEAAVQKHHKKTRRRRHDFSKLSMIYEEDAPFPVPPVEDNLSSSSTA